MLTKPVKNVEDALNLNQHHEVIVLNLIERLETHFGNLRNPSDEDLMNALRALGVSREEVTPFVTEPINLPYGRNFIYQDRNVEVVVINLPGGVSSLPHDHGVSDAYELVIEGELSNSLYKKNDEGEVFHKDETVFVENEICQVPKGKIHAIKNNQLDRAVILTIYCPPIIRQKMYPLAADGIACSKEATVSETE